ncbi:MAG: DUF2283 domain-containing protein [Dehalococcoidia bacterium]|nr:MAG: DUF2283 domain-containing protein [Dehalococcoidia bacterium]
MRITIQRDAEHDIVYIAFSARALKRGSVKKTVRAGEDVSLDFDGRGTLLGLEVMNASKVLGARAGEITLDMMVGVREAAALAGVRPSNFVRDYADRSDFPRPVVELASGRIWARAEIEGYLRSRKRRLKAS